MQNNCYRIFQNIKLFKNHLIADHSVGNKNSSNVRIQPIADISAINDNNSDNGEFDVSASSSFVKMKLICDLDNAEGNIIDFKKQLRYEAAKFASNFYNCQ